MANAAASGSTTPVLRAEWGLKALLVCALAVLMAVPGTFVLLLVADREQRARSVTQEVSALQGGSQQLLGPVLIAPWSTPPTPRQPGDSGRPTGGQTGWYVISPEQGSAHVTTHGQSLHRGIFQVPVYEASATLDAKFAPPPTSFNLPAAAKVDLGRARLVMGFSDLRGAKSDVVGVIATPDGQTSVAFSPTSDISLGTPGGGFPGNAAAQAAIANLAGGPNQGAGSYGLVSAPATALLGAGGDVRVQVRLTGAQRLSVLPFAKSTTVSIGGDWPSPSFDGGFLPETRQLTAKAFSASWTVPFIARGLSAAADSSALSLDALGGKDLGVSFVPANNPYLSVQRALKYAVMFVGLVFLTFFVFESLSGQRLHAAQYVLIGLAQMVFYLLLLSLAEYIGFDLAFGVAAAATVALIGLYAGAAFRSRPTGVLALAIFSVVYGLIYLLMRLEDFALLAGSLASFVGLAVAMYLTRNLDWYGVKLDPPQSAPSTPAGGA